MDLNHISTTVAYKGLSIVSPMMFGDERKDQDRARWFEPGQIACVCDGVSSSPNAAEAATLVTSFIPAVFSGNNHERLTMLCDQLMACRQECQQNSIVLSDDTPQAMRDMLTKIVQKKRLKSFQTTIIAAQFISSEEGITANVFKCGDSACFACSSEGELLTSSLAVSAEGQDREKSLEGKQHVSFVPKRIAFGPGTEILVRVEGQLSQCQRLAQQSGIESKYWVNWLVCAPVDSCQTDNQKLHENLSDLRALSLKPSDRLLVPKYLYGTQLTCRGQKYRVLRYSSTMRLLLAPETPASIKSFNEHSPTTMVLPDHFYCGCYDLFQDQFPPQTHFVLCSDGFYGSFPGWQQLWTWLQENAVGLNDDEQREEILHQLHSDLHARSGDDDISFVWVCPKDSQSAEPSKTSNLAQQKGGDTPCQQKS